MEFRIVEATKGTKDPAIEEVIQDGGQQMERSVDNYSKIKSKSSPERCRGHRVLLILLFRSLLIERLFVG